MSAVCLEGALVIFGQKSGFGALVKANATPIVVIHCLLHKHT